MAETITPYGGSSITAAEMMKVFEDVLEDGVDINSLQGLSPLEIEETSPASMAVSINSAIFVIAGRVAQSYTGPDEVTIGTADGSNPRLDRVIAVLNLSGSDQSYAVTGGGGETISDGKVGYAVKEGTAAASPAADSLEQDLAGSGIYEISLGIVYVGTGVSSITNANIYHNRQWSGWNVGKTLDLDLVAGEDLADRDCVTWSVAHGLGKGGRVYKADASYTWLSDEAWGFGFATHAATRDGPVMVRVAGLLDGFSSLTNGAVQYVSETAGEITESAPTNDIAVAIAIDKGSNDTILIDTRGPAAPTLTA